MALSDDDLYKTYDKFAKMKEETYNTLYNKCLSNIKATANTGDLFCFFKIPKYLFGSSYPNINIESCSNYIMTKLVRANKNIKTMFIDPNIILISWDPNHVIYNLLKQENNLSERPKKQHD